MTQESGMKASGFPGPKSTFPFWRTELHSLDEHRTTEELPNKIDVLIIGAGYAGITTAYHLLEGKNSPPSIAIFEARQICSGATGRNGGHLRPSVSDENVIQQHGLEAAAEVALFEMAHVQAIKDLVEKEQIDCDLSIARANHVVLDKEYAAAVGQLLNLLQQSRREFLQDWEYIEGPKAEEVSGVKGAQGCFSLSAGQLWPYKLFTHLLEIVVAKGVNLQTNTPVSSVAKAQDLEGYWQVQTPRGVTRAKKLVFATNGYTSAILPQYTGIIYPVRGICTRIKTPEDQPAPKLSHTYCINFGQGWDYLIQRGDGSIVVGGGKSSYLADRFQWCNNVDDGSLIEPARSYFDGYMQRNFMGWEQSGAYVDQIWTGIQGYTSDSLPHFGSVPGVVDQFVAAGFNGHGMPVIFLATKGIAKMILEGKSFEETGVPKIFKTTNERLRQGNLHS
ncbi:FAD dependent oxidoreductase superfamily protein-2 [Coleophoma cylindrospora]|uniref:FAD dependent oxidoreductase superfamily protein-2 n=1 Tax=Coleophoma cylindrospora TaxID=1849047 RepID=A0A3D8RG57_9HELO|nr:FAD dependent oxidoreductase superfamily protein-2 [Coleophoma cylindrospora]